MFLKENQEKFLLLLVSALSFLAVCIGLSLVDGIVGQILMAIAFLYYLGQPLKKE